MSAKSVTDTVTGFLSKHVGDLNSIAGILSEVVGVLPIDPQDKGRITDVIGTVKSSADNIDNFLQGTTVTGGEVVVKESDIDNALAAYFESDKGKALIASIVGKANA